MESDPALEPCRVRKVIIRGAKHTHHGVVHEQLQPLRSARTLGEIGNGCLEGVAALRELGVFESADVLCDAAPGASASGEPLADLVVTVVEKKRLTSAKTGVSTQGGEGSVDAAVSVRNLFGRAERLDVNMELGQQKSNAFRLGAVRPRWLGMDAELRAEVVKQSTSHLKRSSHMEKLRGASVGCRVGSSTGPLGSHELAYQLQLRDVRDGAAHRALAHTACTLPRCTADSVRRVCATGVQAAQAHRLVGGAPAARPVAQVFARAHVHCLAPRLPADADAGLLLPPQCVTTAERTRDLAEPRPTDVRGHTPPPITDERPPVQPCVVQ